jgi:1,2-dihydroxy-3-keto-5-methylthiopentene dioxygenase
MTLLTRWSVDEPDTPRVSTTDVMTITSELAAVGIRFEQWSTDVQLAPTASQDEVLDAYRPQIDRLVADNFEDA